VEDAVVPYAVTGDAATDVITATGHIYTANQTVIFSAITGGAGLSANTVYFVRNPSGNTFQLSTTSGGAAINFTTNITAGTVIAIQTNVAISQNTTETNSALVLSPKGTGALIAGPKPNGTSAGGNARGANAIDWQMQRANADQVAAMINSVICGGRNNRIGVGSPGDEGPFIGGGNGNAINDNQFGPSVICGGINNSIVSTGGAVGTNFIGSGSGNSTIGRRNVVCGGTSNSVTATGGGNSFMGSGEGNNVAAFRSVIVGGGSALGATTGNQVTAQYGAILGGDSGLCDRLNMQGHSGGAFSARGDAQRARFVLRNKTTTNAAVELFLDGSATRLTIPSGKVLALTINICGISSTGAAVAHYMRQYALKNVSGTCTEVYAPVTIGTDNAAGTSIALSASDASDALVVSVTGTASTIWRWVASVDAVEIAFGI
jgi:hypothetical protein